MDPLPTYDYLTLARARLLDWVRPLEPAQYLLELSSWRKSLGEILTHVLISEWYYVQRMLQNEVPPYEDWSLQQDAPPPFEKLERLWTEQAGETKAALKEVRDWRAEFEYRVIEEDGAEAIITTSAGALFTQLAFHEVHHRAQVMNMLRQLDVAIEDLDFNALTFGRRPS